MNDLEFLFESDEDLLTIVEGWFKQKPKDYEDVEPKIEPIKALNKAIQLINNNLSKPEFKIFKGKIKMNPKLTGYYDSFINGNEKTLDIATYDMEKIIGKYNGDNEDKFWDAADVLDKLLDNVNNVLNKDGYTLTTSDDSEVYGEGGLAIQKGARIKI